MSYHCPWKILPPAPVTYIADISFCPPIISHLLYHRGIRNAAEAKSFLNPDKQLLTDPFLLPDMGKAVNCITEAIAHHDRIVIWGDFDTDGISGTALLVEGLTSLGAQVGAYIPHRLEEGYGLNIKGIQELGQNGIKLIITVDCGTGAMAETEFAHNTGLRVIITDHHIISATLPLVQALINPRRQDSCYPFAEFAGVGVAFKLLQALVQTMGKSEILDTAPELVALGTVTDMMSLHAENRYLVKRGLEILNHTQRVGLKAMITAAGLQPGTLDTKSISYSLGPRLNTVGRFHHALPAYQLLMTNNLAEADELAGLLEEQNNERKRITEDVWQIAREKIISTGTDYPLLFVSGTEEYHEGILGLVAGKLVEEFHRPAIVIKEEKGACRGSARSLEPFNLFDALARCQDILLQFGGHAMAAGFTILPDKISELRQRLLEIAGRELSAPDLESHLIIDAEVQLADLNEEVLRYWRKLAPFGMGNSEPTFLSRNIEVVECRGIGTKNEHLKLILRDGGIYWDCVAFNLGQRINEITSRLDIVYRLAIDHWSGREKLRLNIVDFTPPQFDNCPLTN